VKEAAKALVIERLKRDAQRKHLVVALAARPEYVELARELVAKAGVEMEVMVDEKLWEKAAWRCLTPQALEREYPEQARAAAQRASLGAPEAQLPDPERPEMQHPETRIMVRPAANLGGGHKVDVEVGPEGISIYVRQ
jgi:hypothetical protein